MVGSDGVFSSKVTTEHGWRSLDPTHNGPQDARYVRVATGRDYADVPPTRGVYKGMAKEKMEVHVKVSES